MERRRTANIELLEAESIGLLEWARIGKVAAHAHGLQLPEGTTPRDAQRALGKLTQAVTIESSPGGNFHEPQGLREVLDEAERRASSAR